MGRTDADKMPSDLLSGTSDTSPRVFRQLLQTSKATFFSSCDAVRIFGPDRPFEANDDDDQRDVRSSDDTGCMRPRLMHFAGRPHSKKRRRQQQPGEKREKKQKSNVRSAASAASVSDFQGRKTWSHKAFTHARTKMPDGIP